MATLNLFPARVPFVDANGCLTPEAQRALQEVFNRLGGTYGDMGGDVFAPFVGGPGEIADAVIQPALQADASVPDVVQPQQPDYGPYVFEMVMQQIPAAPDSLTGTVLDSCVAKGTWTSSGTWTLPALTLGGNVSSTGNPSLNIGSGALTAGTVTTSGGAGISLSPLAWNPSIKAVDLAAGSVYSGGSDFGIGNNAYKDTGGTWRYRRNDYAALYGQYLGVHTWYGAASGTAGNSISWLTYMTVDTAGNLTHTVNSTAPTLTTNKTLTYELTSDTQLKIKVRGSDGTTRSVALTLA